MGVPPVQKGRAGRPSHKNHQIVSYLILIPYANWLGDISPNMIKGKRHIFYYYANFLQHKSSERFSVSFRLSSANMYKIWLCLLRFGCLKSHLIRHCQQRP